MSNQTEYKKLDLQISRCGKHCGACMFLIESFAFGDYKCLLFKEKLISYETYEGTKVLACDDCQSILQT
jgi:hypothetical protein